MIRLAACASLVLLAACPETEKGACERPARQTLVFYDQSASSAADEPTKEIFREAMRDALKGTLECPGDAVRGFLVHANTRGKAGRVDVENTVEPLGDPETMPTVVRVKKESEHKQAMEKLFAEGESRLTSMLATSAGGRLGAQTDLVGTLAVIDDELRRAGQADTLPVRVIYLSDMHESVRSSGRRDFDQRPPRSIAEAEAWADADTVLLDEMRIDRQRMGRVQVRVLMGNLANKDRAGPEIRRYWERLFQHARIRHVEF